MQASRDAAERHEAAGDAKFGEPLVCEPVDTKADDNKYCAVCQMWLNGPTQLEDHHIGKKHKKNTKRQGARDIIAQSTKGGSDGSAGQASGSKQEPAASSKQMAESEKRAEDQDRIVPDDPPILILINNNVFNVLTCHDQFSSPK